MTTLIIKIKQSRLGCSLDTLTPDVRSILIIQSPDQRPTSQMAGPSDQSKGGKNSEAIYSFSGWFCAILNYESGSSGFLPVTINKQAPLSSYAVMISDRNLTDGASPSSAWRPACVRVEVCTIFPLLFLNLRGNLRSWVGSPGVCVSMCTLVCACDRRNMNTCTQRHMLWCLQHFQTPTQRSLWCTLSYSTLWLLCWFN